MYNVPYMQKFLPGESFGQCMPLAKNFFREFLHSENFDTLAQLWVHTHTVVSRARAHSRINAHVPNFKGSLLQLPYKHMEFISRVSAHAGQNCELCLSAHGRLPGTLRYMHSNSQTPLTTSWKVTRVIGEIKFGEIFVPIHSMNLWRKF